MQTDTMFSTASDDHHTPANIATLARACMHGIDLDPASCADANKIIQATYYYTSLQLIGDGKAHRYDGLAQSWACRTLWLNPPFSIDKRAVDGAPIISKQTGKPIRERVIDQWVARWLHAVRSGEVQESAMLLVPARTDTTWFRALFAFDICFVNGRLKFSDAKAGAPFPTVIVYAGRCANVKRFYTLFEDIGECGKFHKDFY